MGAVDNTSSQFDDYRYTHQPDPEGAFAHDLTTAYSKAYEHHWGREPYDKESERIIHSIRGNPNAEVNIYRAVPGHVNEIAMGSWVTLSPKYAQQHLESNVDEGGKILSKRVPAHEVRWEANDINEFGWFPGFS